MKCEIYCRNKEIIKGYILLVVSRSHSRALGIAANTRRRFSFHKTAPFINEKKEADGLPFEYPVCFVSEQHKHSLNGRKHSGIVSM